MSQTLVELVRAKYPGAYDDLDDLSLDALVREKHPGVYDDLPKPVANFRTETEAQGPPADYARYGPMSGMLQAQAEGGTKAGAAVVNAAKGVKAGAASTLFHGGDLIRRGLGMERVIDRPEVQAAMKPPDGMAGKIGFYGEQAAEFGVPLARIARVTKGMPILKRMGVDAATSAGVAGIQSGGDTGSMGVSAALGGALPVAGKVAGAVGGAVKRTAAGAQEGGVGGAVAAAVRRVVPTDTRTMLVQGLKPRATKTGFEGSLGRAVPEIKTSESELGKAIETVDDLLAATKHAKKRVRAQYDEMAGPMREMGSTIDLSEMADAMVRSIPKKTRIEDPRKYAEIVERANQYRRSFNLEDAEQILRETNAELDSYYSKFPAARRKALDANPETAQLEAQAVALRDAIYKRLDDPGQGDAARELNRRYGALLDVEDAAYRRSIVAKRQQPDSLSEQVGSIHAAKDFARAGFKTMRGDLMGAGMDLVSGAAMRDTSRFLKERQTSDALVKRAFAAYRGGPPEAVTMPVRRPVRGLIGKGSTPMGPSPDTSYAKGVPAQYGEKWTPPAEPPPPVTVAAKPVAPKAALSIRPKTRGEVDGFSITGRDELGRSVSIFTKTREAADHIRAKKLRGEDIVAADFQTDIATEAKASPVKVPATPQLPPPLPRAAYQTPQTRTESAAVRRARALREERQQRDEMAAAAPKPTIQPAVPADDAIRRLRESKVASAPVTPKPASTPTVTPAKAAEKVEQQLERVVDLSGAKSATEIQSRVLKALADEIEPSRAASASTEARRGRAYGGREGNIFVGDEPIAKWDKHGRIEWHRLAEDTLGVDEATLKNTKITPARGDGMTATELARYAELAVAKAIGTMKSAGVIRVQIPGDGTFTIQRNPAAIAETIARIKKAGPSVWGSAPKPDLNRSLKKGPGK